MTTAGTGRPFPRRILAALVVALVLAPAAGAGQQGGVGEGQASGPERGTAGAMLARPLFSPTRRPPPPPPSAALPPLSAPDPSRPSTPNIALSGVIVGPGGGVALVRGPRNAAPVRVRLGATVEGWTVAEIRPRAVVLHRDGQSATVDLPAER